MEGWVQTTDRGVEEVNGGMKEMGGFRRKQMKKVDAGRKRRFTVDRWMKEINSGD